MRKIDKCVNGGNYFIKERFEVMCQELEKGECIEVYIDCIGHTRNNMTQEEYKEHFIEKYGDKVEVIYNDGVCSYSYSYKLNY